MSDLVSMLGNPYFLFNEAKTLQLLYNTIIDGIKVFGFS